MSPNRFRDQLMARIAFLCLEQDGLGYNVATGLSFAFERILGCPENKEGWDPQVLDKTDVAIARITDTVLTALKPRPIATAPRDGTLILLIGPDGFDENNFPWHHEIGSYVDGQWRNMGNNLFNEGAIPPTHWMPLDMVTPTAAT